MRHRKTGKILDRKKASREALIRSLATSLVLYEKIKTTEAKAKALRPFVEKMITKSKAGTLHARRELLKEIYTESAVKKLMEDIGPRYKERKGGYTRIIKFGPRPGDGAAMARIELV